LAGRVTVACATASRRLKRLGLAGNTERGAERRGTRFACAAGGGGFAGTRASAGKPIEVAPASTTSAASVAEGLMSSKLSEIN